MDTLFKNVTAVLMDDSTTVMDNAYIGVEAGKITYIGAELPKETAQTVIDGTGKVLMPGLVNAHTHLPMTLLRGYADDMDLQTWLFDHIFPAEEKLTPETIHTGTLLALMECIASGTVSVTDMYSFVVPAVVESGLKGNLCLPLIQPGVTDYSAEDDKRLNDAKKLVEDYHKHDNGRILIDAAIHAEYTSCPAIWEAAAQLAQDKDLGMHVHVSETAREHAECIERYNMTPIAVLDKHGLFGTRTTAAHCVHVSDDDMDIMAARGVTAAHNPVSNLKLASGIARVREMRDRGVNVALGTDGTASNNSLDMFEEMKLAAILAAGDKPLTAAGALKMATINGAKAQGRKSGAIAEGYDADIILVDFDRPHLTPKHNVISSLVYSARGSDVTLTMVGGKILYRDGVFLTIDREKVLAEARKAACIF